MNWTERDAAVVWHGFTQMSAYGEDTAVVVDRAEGRELIDVEGNRYLDAFSSLWVTTLGHRVPELDEALRGQLDRVAHSTLLGNGNRVVIELAEALADVVPVASPHFLFASDGASAVEQALKLALQYWRNIGDSGRNRFLAFGDAYHGDTVGALSVSASGLGLEVFDRLRFSVLRAPAFSAPDALAQAAELVETEAERLAAVIVEPLVQAAAGIQTAPAGDFALLAEACQKSGVLLICDEIATGFGRTGTLFAAQQCGLEPDLLCIGAGLTGGYLPMSATVATQRVFDAFLGPDLGECTFHHGHSCGGNALAAAVALRHLELLRTTAVLDNVGARSLQLAQLLEERIAARGSVAAIRLVGLMGAIELDSDDPFLAQRTASAMVRRGVLTRALGNVVTLVPPLSITADEIERIVTALEGALLELGL
jgi:adenosylmethionine---8-amino-7-oxononanoate aminotransferase